MGNIKIMPDDLANKIAAGEVVEGPISVVKELVENSIDANSTEIKIDLIESGIKEIKVTDNGSGMDRTDALLSLERHATSKLMTIDELTRIHTLGFRGEAIPSIASISEFTLKTSTGEVGIEIYLKGGKDLKENKSDSRKGTTITVKNIFFNTPARYKYLKSLYVELAKITEYITKISLAHTNVKFILTNDDKELFLTEGKGNLLKTINSIYGVEIAKNMMETSAENEDYRVYGYISKPETNRSNRNHMTLIVNKRVVKNYEINKTIEEAYHTYLPIGKYPITVLNIEGDPTLLDVNIHPSKLEVKFSKLEELKELIRKAIKSNLETKRFIPKVENKEPLKQYQKLELDLSENMIKEPEVEYFNSTEKELEKLPTLYPVGNVHGTYLIFQNETGMFLVDQHAAKERINYEYYLEKLGNPKNNSQKLLIPITIELPKHDYIILKENLNILEALNFDIEEFGINTIIIKAHPNWLLKGYEEESIRKIIDIILVNEKFDTQRFNESIAITLSCKLSIKANDNVTISEMENLIKDLRRTKNPYTCPHGRPTIIEYPTYELEKLFKRVM